MKQNPELESVELLARIILTAARTTPKGKGIDDIITCLLSKDEKNELASKMEELSEIKDLKFLIRDAQNIRDADAIVLIGLKSSGVSSLDCGVCGFGTCKEMLEHEKVQKEFIGPQCMIKYIKLFIKRLIFSQVRLQINKKYIINYFNSYKKKVLLCPKLTT
jgi:uncharacterized ferredoxin-like protein